MKKLFIFHADNQMMNNLPKGIETLIIYGVRGWGMDKVFSNLPITLKNIYVRTAMYEIREKMFPKLPIGCEIVRINLSYENCDINYDNFEKEMVYRNIENNTLFKSPLYGYSKLYEKYIKIQFEKEYEAPEYKYSLQYEFLFLNEIA